MTWMPWLIIGLALCMILGPIMLLKPSPRQQRLAKLRALAPKLGLKIHMAHLGGEERAVYQLPWPVGKKRYHCLDWCLERKTYIHDIHLCQYWYWVDNKIPDPEVVQLLRQQLPLLPESINGVAANSQGLSCFWDERGGFTTQEVMAKWLQQTQTMLWPLVAKAVDQDKSVESKDKETDDW